MHANPFRLRLALALTIAALALGLRLRAVDLLPIDYDEDDYMRAGQQYAAGLQSGDLSVFLTQNYRPEHPPLSKIGTGIAISFLPPALEIPDRPTTAAPAAALPQPHLDAARTLQAAYGTLQVLALALVNPAAALFLAIQTWQIKYTSQVMLEGLPSLTSLLAVLAFARSGGRRNAWLWLSAVLLGLTAAGKYPYALAGVAIAAYWLWSAAPRDAWRAARRDPRLRTRALVGWLAPVLAWGLIALAVFFLADPYLWPDPLGRLESSLLYHEGYARSAAVQNAGYTAWQPLTWLLTNVPWHPGVFLASLDLAITFFAFAGLPRLWREQRVMALWLLLTFVFLLAWPTKWPQYILMLTAPVALAAGLGFESAVARPLLARLREVFAGRARLTGPDRSARRELRRALPWLLLGTLVLCAIALFPLVYQAVMAFTDFNVFSIRDGMQGGVWRAFWQGITGQADVVAVELFPRSGGIRANEVHYAGPELLLQLLGGAASDVMSFNLIWTVLAVALQGALGVGIALLLNQQGLRGKNWWRALFILPWALPEFVGALVWLHMFEPRSGWVSLALHRPLPWNNDPLMAMGVLLVAATWLGWPFVMLAATASLRMIPLDVYEASALDGANRWQQFRDITWPMLLPLLAPALILRTIFSFNQFYLFYVMQAPVINFATLSFLFFDSTSGWGGSFAVAAALNLFTVAVLIALIAWFNRWSRAAEGVTYA